ncbi:hypothetical protein BSLG_005914 [Batrachochytrium salamandrivorans]|nr:hypothetical protein BSLG_005914 [Batrachochytrium salamandrivorans]
MMESSTVGIALTMNESVAPTAPIGYYFYYFNSRESSSPQTPPQTPPLDLTQSQSWPSMPLIHQAQQLTNKGLCGDCLVRSSDDLHSHVHTEYDPQTPYHEADNNLNHEQKMAELTNAVGDQHHIFDSADHANHASDLQLSPMARMIGLVALFPILSPNQRTTTEMIGRAHDELYLDVMILPAYRGHGYATESAKRVLMEHFAPSANAISTPLPFSSLSNTTDTILQF